MSKLNEYYNIANGLDALLEEYGKELTEDGTDKGINGYLVHNVPDYADKYNYIVARYAEDYDSLWFWGAWKDEKPAREAAEDVGGIVIYRNGYEKDHQPETEETDECLKEAEEKVKEYKITCTFKDEPFVNEVQLSGKNPEEVKKAFIEYLTDPDNFDSDEEPTLKPEDIKNLKIEEITTESLKESKQVLKEDNQYKELFNQLGKYVYHITSDIYLDNIKKKGLTNFWFGIDVETCEYNMANMIQTKSNKKDWSSEHLILILIPKKELDINKCHFEEDCGLLDGDNWSGECYYEGTVYSFNYEHLYKNIFESLTEDAS